MQTKWETLALDKMYATNNHANLNLQKHLRVCESETAGLLYKIYV